MTRGGKREGAGRPPEPIDKNLNKVRFERKVTPEEYKILNDTLEVIRKEK